MAVVTKTQTAKTQPQLEMPPYVLASQVIKGTVIPALTSMNVSPIMAAVTKMRTVKTQLPQIRRLFVVVTKAMKGMEDHASLFRAVMIQS